MKKIVWVLVAGITAFSFQGALAAEKSKATASAVQQKAEVKPVLIIRFNQPGISYQQAVQQVVEKVQSVKPSAIFGVVSLIPSASSHEARENNKALAEHNGQKVAAAIRSTGVAGKRVQLSYENNAQVPTNEVHIIVQ